MHCDSGTAAVKVTPPLQYQRLALPWLPDCTSSGATLSFLPLDPTVPASFDLDTDRDMLAVIRGTQAVYARTDETVHLLEIRFRVGRFP